MERQILQWLRCCTDPVCQSRTFWNFSIFPSTRPDCMAVICTCQCSPTRSLKCLVGGWEMETTGSRVEHARFDPRRTCSRRHGVNRWSPSSLRTCNLSPCGNSRGAGRSLAVGHCHYFVLHSENKSDKADAGVTSQNNQQNSLFSPSSINFPIRESEDTRSSSSSSSLLFRRVVDDVGVGRIEKDISDVLGVFL